MIYDHYYFLNKIFQLKDLSESQISQKEKYNFLNFMLCELCKANNSKERIIDISGHIILFLHLYKKNFAEINIFTEEHSLSFKDNNSKKAIEILKKEFIDN